VGRPTAAFVDAARRVRELRTEAAVEEGALEAALEAAEDAVREGESDARDDGRDVVDDAQRTIERSERLRDLALELRQASADLLRAARLAALAALDRMVASEQQQEQQEQQEQQPRPPPLAPEQPRRAVRPPAHDRLATESGLLALRDALLEAGQQGPAGEGREQDGRPGTVECRMWWLLDEIRELARETVAHSGCGPGGRPATDDGGRVLAISWASAREAVAARGEHSRAALTWQAEQLERAWG